MDDINQRIVEARRRAALDAQAQPAEPRPDEPASPPVGEGALRLERRQGEWRYYLGEHRVRPGMPIEFYVDPRLGWVRGTFQWGRRNVSVPTIRIAVVHPEDPGRQLGELEVTLPEGAICRWP
jgi:hypothetical protein